MKRGAIILCLLSSAVFAQPATDLELSAAYCLAREQAFRKDNEEQLSKFTEADRLIENNGSRAIVDAKFPCRAGCRVIASLKSDEPFRKSIEQAQASFRALL